MPCKCLVTGGAGFLGSHLVDRLIKDGNSVVCVDNFYTGAEGNLKHLKGNDKLTVVKHDVVDPFPESITGGIGQIYHLACAASPVHYQAEPVKTLLTCVNGAVNVLDLAKEKDIPILIASTSEVYGDPEVHPQPEEYKGSVSCTGPRACYDEGKRAAETLCFDYHRQYKTKVRVARIFNTYGPRMTLNDGRIISNFAVQALSGKDITVYGDGQYTRSFQYVDDLIEGFIRLINSNETGPVNLGNPEEYTVLEIAQKIRDMCKSQSKIVHLEKVVDDPQQRCPNIEKAKTLLGWEPSVTVDEGLNRTITEFKQRVEEAQQ